MTPRTPGCRLVPLRSFGSGRLAPRMRGAFDVMWRSVLVARFFATNRR